MASYRDSYGSGGTTGYGESSVDKEDATTRYQNMGKGSSPSVPQTNYMKEAEAKDWLAQQEYNRNQQTAADQKTKDDAAKLAQEGETAGDVTRYYTGGSDYLTRHLADLGFTDTYGIGSRFQDALDAAKGLVPKTEENVGSYFNYNDMFDTAKSGATTAERGKLTNAYNTLTPTGWQENYFADTADDPILNAILEEQKGETQSTLDRKLGRGQMSQGAYDYALGQLGKLSGAANSKLQSLGGGVLSGYRDQLGNLANAFNNQVTNYQLGQNVDTGGWGTQLQNKATSLGQNMEGDIRTALGGTELFDPYALIAKAGSAAGASNQPVFGSTAQGTGAAQPLEEQNRSTGTTGIF
jgi:hypothetical protein